MLDTTKKEIAIQILHRNWDEVIAGEAECEGIVDEAAKRYLTAHGIEWEGSDV